MDKKKTKRHETISMSILEFMFYACYLRNKALSFHLGMLRFGVLCIIRVIVLWFCRKLHIGGRRFVD